MGQGGRQGPQGWRLPQMDVLVFFPPDSLGALMIFSEQAAWTAFLHCRHILSLSSLTQFCLLLPSKHPPFWGDFQKGRS